MFFESGGSKPLPIENVAGAADEVNTVSSLGSSGGLGPGGMASQTLHHIAPHS